MPVDSRRVQAVFLAAVDQENSSDRQAVLDRECGTDDELRRRVEALLRANDEPASYLDRPAVEFTKSVGTMDFPPITERPGSRVGPYRLMEQIGEGGFGLVFVAEQQEPVKRKVALKVIKPGMDSKQVIARFEAERQALALMDHPNIAKVLDAGATDSGRPYFVMELVRGISITEYCDQNQLAPRERLDLFISVCQAIQHAHQKGIIHRDIKPSNVLVTSHDGKPVAKVIDFGVAKAIHQHLTERTIYTNFAQMVGTPLYMSPEQAEMSGLDIDTRSDIYSLGVLLYELLTGTTPLEKKQLCAAAYDEIRRLIREEEPPKPSTRLSNSSESLPSVAAQRKMEPAKLSRLVRGDLDWITMKALEKDRTRRYETASGLARDVQRYLSDEPVEACPPSARDRLRRFTRKNRAALSTATLIAVILLTGVAVSVWQAMRARQAEAAAIAERDERERARQAEAERAEGEKRAKETAQQRLKQIEKSTDILGSIFQYLDPNAEEKEGKSLRVLLAERLDQATNQLDADAVGDPLTTARLQSILGLSQKRLGFPDRATLLFSKARQTRAALLGATHPDTLNSMHDVATALDDAGRLADAVPLYEETLRLRKEILGHRHPDTLNSMGSLAYAYQNAGRRDEALPLYEETLRLRKEILGPMHASTLASMNNLAYACDQAGRSAEAIALYEDNLKCMKEAHGATHPETLVATNNLAYAYKIAGRLREAMPLFEETLKIRKEKLGATHPHTITSMNNLALAYRDALRLNEALALFEEALKLSIEKLGSTHPDTLISMGNLATTYQREGRLAEALPLFETTLKCFREQLGPTHPDTLISMCNLADAYLQAGRLAEALPLCEDTLRLSRDKLGPDHPDTLHYMNNLARAYLDAGRRAEALALNEKNLQLTRDKFGSAHIQTLSSVSMLARAYLIDKQCDKAMPLFRQFLVGRRQLLGSDSPVLAAIYGEVAGDLLKFQQSAEAEELLREGLTICDTSASDDWTKWTLQSMLGAALLGQKKYGDAEPLLLAGYAGMNQHVGKISPPGRIPPKGKIRMTDAAERLVQLYEATNKPDEAAKWKKEWEGLRVVEKPPAKP